MNKVILKSFIVSLLAIIQLSFSAFAADEKPHSLADVWVMVPNPGQQAGFEKAFQEHIKYRASKGDPRQWQAYTPVIGKNLNYYVVRYCCTAFKDVEAYKKWESDNKMDAHWNENVAKYVAHYEHYYSRIDFKNSNWPDGKNNYKYFAVTDYSVKVGAGKGVSEGKKVLSETAKAMKWPYSWSWTWQIGGDENLSLVIPYENYAEMEDPDKSFSTAFAEQIGDADKAAAVFKAWGENFHSTQYTVYVLREDMSMSTD
ncbi:hypothetical protein RGQ13_11780 [Thalassotalea psychrophila]|uniref:ABM domain-containing protein n=1 Tax=Thalassotalea psychrophila TaxID=3065647 RepID=A0ABY9TPZ1_9GAMM|nr:hypothetical protein RGQ13_11780 [Colwelliaceae bacterium SQ149]